MQQDIDLIMRATEAHHTWYRDCLPMIASNNLTSKRVRLLAATDLAHRYAEGVVGHRFYQGCRYIDEIEAKTITLAKELFRAEHVNVQPTSGVNANIAAFFALADPGDTIISLDVPQGGHISHVQYSAAGVRGLRVVQHPFDPDIMNIDADCMVAMIRETKPRIVLLGGSLFLFPHPVREACEAAHEVGATVVYDGAHVLGLIAGNCFQDPLREGADVMTGSTHKTFPGPQGAVIFCKEGLSKKIDEAVFPGTVSNHHLHHLAGLGVALAEMIEFGKDYASDVIANAKTLAQSLYERGFDVLCEPLGFTESHQVAIDVTHAGGSIRAATKLEEANIIVNKNLLPGDHVSVTVEPSGIRIGAQELTRIGMGASEMNAIADFMKRIVLDDESPESVRDDVIELKSGYQMVCYCFDDTNAYGFPVIR
ncbi:MAG: serine hydroxymethyltransferase [Methanosarcinales archaeon]|nr:serine hydroxymethyltransferase [Methanosarcinales archaeon]